MGKKSIETLVGVFVLLGMLGLVFLALKAANLGSVGGGDTYMVQARFDNIGGLKPRAPVRTGARIFRDVTRESVGKRMAILLFEKGKGEVVTAPVIRSEIGGGRVQISGRMTSVEANDTALLLRAGFAGSANGNHRRDHDWPEPGR